MQHTTSQATPVVASSEKELTFVFCVDSGIYESMAVRAVESLRRFGGRFADCDVIALTTRIGPPLARSTRDQLADLNVRTVFRPHLRHDWFPWMGKVWAAVDGARLASTQTVAYVDCDVLFLGEPAAFSLADDVDLAAAFPDSGIVGTTGPGSLYESAWERACKALGLSVDDLPWVDARDGSGRIRFYVNAGVFVFRTRSNLPEKWLECTELLFRHRADFGTWREQFYEQVALGLAAIRDGIPFAELPYSHNFGVDTSLPAAWDDPELAAVRVLHYHDQLSASNWQATTTRLERTHVAAAEWLSHKGPVVDPSGWTTQVARGALQRARLVTRRGYRMRGWVARKRGRENLLGGLGEP
jgi:hypothetical protein